MIYDHRFFSHFCTVFVLAVAIIAVIAEGPPGM
jgi:hypothetical protein